MSEQMRDEFNAAFRKKYGFGVLTASANADAHQMLAAAEWAWQASRAALVVMLPPHDKNEKPYACYEGGWNDMRNETIEAITAAGVAYK